MRRKTSTISPLPTIADSGGGQWWRSAPPRSLLAQRQMRRGAINGPAAADRQSPCCQQQLKKEPGFVFQFCGYFKREVQYRSCTVRLKGANCLTPAVVAEKGVPDRSCATGRLLLAPLSGRVLCSAVADARLTSGSVLICAKHTQRDKRRGMAGAGAVAGVISS